MEKPNELHPVPFGMKVLPEGSTTPEKVINILEEVAANVTPEQARIVQMVINKVRTYGVSGQSG